MIAGKGIVDSDFMILNSAAFFDQALPLCAAYQNKYLFLDRDSTGQNCSRIALASEKNYLDCSIWYKDSTDLNEWLIKAGNKDKLHFREHLNACKLLDSGSQLSGS